MISTEPIVSSHVASATLSQKAPRPSLGPRAHLRPLDGIRGLAILMVILMHGFSANAEGGGPVTAFLGNALNYGMFGVDIFFALSGFLITGILVDTMDDQGYFGKFYARRALRIFPLYYGVLLVLFLLTPVLRLHWGGMGWLAVGYLQNLKPMSFYTFSPGAGINIDHFWSLEVEEQFYLVWPAVVFFIRDRRRLLLFTIVGSLGALLLRLVLLGFTVNPQAIHVLTFCRVDSLLIGGAFALLFRSAYWPRVVRMAPYGFFGAVALVVGSIALLGPDTAVHPSHPLAMLYWVNGPRYSLLALGSGFLIAWSLGPLSVCGRMLEAKWLSFFGKYSYGIYVLHLIALDFFLRKGRALIFQWTHSKLLGVLGAGCVALLLAIGAAYLSFHLFEKPMLRLKRSFEYDRKPA